MNGPPYRYHGSLEHQDRLRHGRDHCKTEGPVHDVATLVCNGLARSPGTTDLLTTPAMNAEGIYIYAVGLSGEMRVAADGGDRSRPHAIKHETLYHNDDVMAAGEVVFRDGVVVDLNDKSGSYRTFGEMRVNPDFCKAVLDALERTRVTLDLRADHPLTALSP